MIQALVLAFGVTAFAADAPAAKPDATAAAAPATTADDTPLPAQATAPSMSPAELDKASEARVKEFEECVDTLAYFREDLKKKKADLDKEFKGKVPSSFGSLIALKANRIAKQNLACSKMNDFLLDAEMASLRSMDGGSSAYSARLKKIGSLRERVNKAQQSFASSN